jgi:NADH-quinone oxidoreductase subunit K
MVEIAVFSAAFLAAAGVYGMLSRRNLAFVILSLELILNAGILLLILSLPLSHRPADTLSVALLLLAVGAAEVAFGFALAVVLARKHRTSDILTLTHLEGKVER